jgi:UDP-2,4-diacetamido-2,4,6-trideoxy-beta-L-altropyranose hydrolase
MNLNVAIRVDASTRMGSGHVMRCLTLADALGQQGATVRFLSRELPDDLERTVTSRGHQCVRINADPLTAGEENPRDTAAALSDRAWHWLIADQYSLGAAWEREMRTVAECVFAIDDLADRAHDCDVLLDQNHLEAGAARYDGKVPKSCRVLVGPRYALLRPEYRAWRERRLPRNGPVQRVLVFFGGGDAQHMTELALEALTHPEFAHIAVDVVVGSDPSRRRVIAEMASRRGGITVHGPRPHLADLMAGADLSLGAGGSTTWERMCVGLRSLVVTLAANQEHVAQWLEREGLIRLIGAAPHVTVNDIREA